MLRPEYPIVTERLELRPFTEADFEPLFAMYSRQDVTRYLYWSPRSHDEVRDALAVRLRSTILQAEGDWLILAMQLRSTGAVAGEILLKWTSATHRSGEVGFVLHPDHHGRGYAGEAARQMLRLGFDEMELHRIVGRCDGRNTASYRVMEKLEMRLEAHFVENEFVKGEWCDERIYSMLAREWRSLTA